MSNHQEVKLSNTNFSGHNFSCTTLNKVFFHNCYFRDTNFSESNLVNCHFENCYVVASNFKKSNFENVHIINSYILNTAAQNSVWTNVVLNNVDMRGVLLDYACFTQVHLKKIDFTGISLNNFKGTINSYTEISCKKIYLDNKEIILKDSRHLQMLIEILTREEKRDSDILNFIEYLPRNSTVHEQVELKKTRIDEEFETENLTIHKSNPQKNLSKRFPINNTQNNPPPFPFPGKKQEENQITITKKPRLFLQNKYKYLLIACFCLLLGSVYFFRTYLYIHYVLYKLDDANLNGRTQAVSMIENLSYDLQTDKKIVSLLVSKLDEEDLDLRRRIGKILALGGEPCLRPILNVLYSGTKRQKIASLQVVSQIQDSYLVVMPILLELIQSKDVDIQIAATNLLFHFKYNGNEAMPYLLDNLRKSNNDNLKVVTIRAISQMGAIGMSAEDLILDSLQADYEPLASISASALADLCYPTPKVVGALHKKLIGTTDIRLQKNIIWAIGHLADKGGDITEIIPFLISFVKEKEWKHGYYAAQAMGKAKKQSIPFLQGLFQFPDTKVRELTAISAAIMDDDAKEMEAEIIEAILVEKDKDVLLKQLELLKSIGIKNERLFTFLMNSILSKNTDSKVRNSCIQSLGYTQIYMNKTIDFLVKIVKNNDENNSTRMTGITALENIKGVALEKIWELLSFDSDKEIIKLTLFALKKMEENREQAIPVITKLISYPDDKVKIEVLRLLVSWKEKNSEVKKTICQALRSKSIKIKIDGTYSLYTLKFYNDKEIKSCLIENLNNKNEFLRYVSASALVRLNFLDREYLKKLLDDHNEKIQQLALEALNAPQNVDTMSH